MNGHVSAPACFGCSALGPHGYRVPVFEGQVLPATWQGDWMQAIVCGECFARHKALLHPVTLMVFRHMRKGT